jgi:hypothetical protein
LNMERKSKPHAKAAHLANLQKNLEDISKLLEVHALVSSTVSGRANSLQVLNRSAIVLMTSCWEAFIEDLATSSFDWLLAQCQEPKLFPAKVRARASTSLRVDKNELAVWELAGDGWRRILLQHRDESILAVVGSLNTPRFRQIDDLYESLIALKGISRSWRWPSMTADKSRAKLEKLITIRGNIAHRARHDTLLRRPELDGYLSFIFHLAVQSHNAVVNHLTSHVGTSPWGIAKFEHPDPARAEDRRGRMKRSWQKRGARTA